MTFNFISVRSGNSDIMPMDFGGRRGEKGDWNCVVLQSKKVSEKSIWGRDGMKREDSDPAQRAKSRVRNGGGTKRRK